MIKWDAVYGVGGMGTVPVSPPPTMLTVTLLTCRNEQTVYRTETLGFNGGTRLALQLCHQHFQMQGMNLVS